MSSFDEILRDAEIEYGALPESIRRVLERAYPRLTEEDPSSRPMSPLDDAIKDVCWKATPFGEREDGSIHAYIVPAGALHRLVGAAQGAGVSAALRAIGATVEGIPNSVDTSGYPGGPA